MLLFTLLTENDPWQEIRGGQAAFARSLLDVFGDEIAVACHGGDSAPEGRWSKRPWRGKDVWFFNLGGGDGGGMKTLLPRRISGWRLTRKHISEIRKLCGRCLIDNPEQFFPAATLKWESIAYLFSGVNNPVSNSRDRWLRWAGPLFDFVFVRKLRAAGVSLFLAAASRDSIEEFAARTGNVIRADEIFSFPPRVDNTVFYRRPDRERLRNELHVDGPFLVVTGRLGWIKGWRLLLGAFADFRRRHADATLCFLGDGEDRPELEREVRRNGLTDRVVIRGFVDREETAKYLNAADLYLCGSHKEGWSVAMCEALACGCTVVSTPVSGAVDMVRNGRNGFLVPERDPQLFAAKMDEALRLTGAAAASLEIAERYRIDTLRTDLTTLWANRRTADGTGRTAAP